MEGSTSHKKTVIPTQLRQVKNKQRCGKKHEDEFMAAEEHLEAAFIGCFYSLALN